MSTMLTWAIDRYLGQFITGINTDRLKMDLWRGHVEFLDLMLREDVLQAAGLPLRVAGVIQTAELDVSRTGALKLTIKGMHVVLTPLLGEEARNVRLRAIKAREIRNRMDEALSLAPAAQPDLNAVEDVEQGRLSQRIFAGLLDKVELKLSDVQISYDHGPAMGVQLRAHLTVEAISAVDAASVAGPLSDADGGTSSSNMARKKLVQIVGITLAVGRPDQGDGADLRPCTSDVLVVPRVVIDVGLGNGAALYAASVNIPSVQIHARQWQLREAYLLANQWENAAQRALAAQTQYAPPTTVDSSVRARYSQLYQQQTLAGALGTADAKQMLNLENQLSAADIAMLRIEVERSDVKVKKSTEGWFAWAGRVMVASGSEPQPEPQVESGEGTTGLVGRMSEPHADDCSKVAGGEGGAQGQDKTLSDQDGAEGNGCSSETAATRGVRWQLFWSLSSAIATIYTDGTDGIDGTNSVSKVLGEVAVEQLNGLLEKPMDLQVKGIRAQLQMEGIRVVDRLTIGTRFPLILSSEPPGERQGNGFLLLEYIPRGACLASGVAAENDSLSIRVGPFRAVYNMHFVGELDELLTATLLGTDRAYSSERTSTRPKPTDCSTIMMTGMLPPMTEQEEQRHTPSVDTASEADEEFDGKSAAQAALKYYRERWRAMRAHISGMDVEVAISGPVLMLPESFSLPQCPLLVVRAEHVEYRSCDQKSELEGDEYEAKVQLSAWESRLQCPTHAEFSCLDRQMPYRTFKFNIGTATMHLSEFVDTGVSRAENPEVEREMHWDGSMPSGVDIVCCKAGFECLCMRRSCSRIVSAEKMPRMLFILNFPTELHVDWTEECYQDLMGILNGFSFSAFAAERVARSVQLMRLPCGGPQDVCEYQVHVCIKKLLVNVSVAANLSSRGLVRIAAEDLGLRLSAEREGRMTVAASVQGLAAQDMYSGVADSYLIWVKKMASHGSEPVEFHYSSDDPFFDLGSTDHIRLEINNPAKVTWSPETIERTMKFLATGLNRLFQMDSGPGSSVLPHDVGHIYSSIQPRTSTRGGLKFVSEMDADDPDDDHAPVEYHSQPSQHGQNTPIAGESRYTLCIADMIFLLEYPEAIKADNLPSRPLAGAMHVRNSSSEFLWDYEHGIYSVHLVLNQLALSKSEVECRTDPTLSFSSAVIVKYRELLDRLRGVQTGYAYKTTVDLPPLRCVVTPTSLPLLCEMYMYLFYSFLQPLVRYDGESSLDKTAPAETNFMALQIHVKNPRVLMTGNVSRKGWYFFEASMDEFVLTTELNRHVDIQHRQLPGVRELYTAKVVNLHVQHPGSGDTIVASMDFQTTWAQSFLSYPYAWVDAAVSTPTIHIKLPESIPKYLGVVARDHLDASRDATTGTYTQLMQPAERYSFSRFRATLPMTNVSYVQDGNRSISCSISQFHCSRTMDDGVYCHSLQLACIDIDAPHQHVLTRIVRADWTDSHGDISDDFVFSEQSDTGNVINRVTLPRIRAVLYADAIMSIKSVVDHIQEPDDIANAGLDDIMEEPISPRGGDSVLDELDNPAFEFRLSSTAEKQATVQLRTSSVKFTARETEIVIPETNRTDLLLFKFGMLGEYSHVFGRREIRCKIDVKHLSASMGHWGSTRFTDSNSRYADWQIDSNLLREFVANLEYVKCRVTDEENTEHPDKSTLVFEVGPTQILASADQMYSSTGMIEHLIDEFLDDDEERNPAVFTAEDPGFDADFDPADRNEEYGDIHEFEGSVISATTGRSALSKGRSAFSSKHSEYTDGMSDADWHTVGSESDQGSYAMRSRHSAHARSSGGSSDGETESVGAGTFHSAEDDQYVNEMFFGSASRHSWDRGSDQHTSSAGSESSRQREPNKRTANTTAAASMFGIELSLPVNLTVKVTCPTISLTLTSDPFGQVTPLWSIQIDDASFMAKSVSAARTVVTMKLTVQLKYFNLSVLCWESAVEPMLLSVDGHHSAGLWTLDVHSGHNLNCNLSEALLQALEQLTDTSKSGPNSSAVETAPYKLINTTGAPILYSIGLDLDKSTESKPMLLETGQTAEYKLGELLRSERNMGNFTARYITFRMEGTATKSVCIDKPAEHMLVLQNQDELDANSEDGSSSARFKKVSSVAGIGIVCKVSKGETKGTRQIVVGSAVTVRNATNIPLEIMAEAPQRSGNHMTEVIEVQPGDTEFIPVKFTRPNSGSALRVRPIVFGEESFWSMTTFDLHRQTKPGDSGHRQTMVCTQEDRRKGAFCVAVAMSILPSDSIQRKVITLYPMLVIENLLPVAMDYRFIDRGGTRVMELDDMSVNKLSGIMIGDNGEVVTNEMSADLHHMESFDEWLLQVKIGDHEAWSEKVPIRVGLRHVVVQNDDSEDPLQLIVHGTLSNQASLRISVSCPFWIVNKTVEELQTRPWVGVNTRSKSRKSLLKRVTKLYPDHLAPFSCESDRFSVQVPGFDWSFGISLAAVGTTDFFLQQPAEGLKMHADHVHDNVERTLNPIADSEIELGITHQSSSQQTVGKGGCQLGLNISSGTGPLAKTKIFTFMPFFRMDNQVGEDLLVRQSFQPHELSLRADMHDMSFQWSDMRSSKRVQISFIGDEWGWSGGIDIARHNGEFFVPLSKKRDRKATKMRTRDYIVRGEVKNTEQSSTDSMRMIVFNKEDDKFPPYLILNACSQFVNVRQVGTDRTIVVQSGTVRPYACEEPFAPHVIEVWVGDANSMSVRLVGEQAVDIDVSQEVTANASSEGFEQLRVHVDCSGPVTRVRVEQVLPRGVNNADTVTDLRAALPTFELESVSNYMSVPGIPMMDDTNPVSMQRMRGLGEVITGEVRKRGKDLLAGAKDIALEVGDIVKEQGRELLGGRSLGYKIARLGHDTRKGKNIGITLASVRVSFIGTVDTHSVHVAGLDSDTTTYATQENDTSRKEIILLVLDDVRVKVVTNENQQKAELSVCEVQVDNQSHKTKFPVLLSIAAAGDEDSVVFHIDRSEFNDRIEYFDYAALQIKDEIHIQLDQEWLASTGSFLSRLQDKLFGQLSSELPDPGRESGLGTLFSKRTEDDVGDGSKISKNLYFDVLRLEPVHIRMDLSSVKDNVFTSLPNISNLTIRISELQMKSPYGSAKRIVKDEIFAHYKRHYHRALYKVLGYKLVPHNGLIEKLVRGVFDCVRTPILMTRREVQLVQDGYFRRAVVNFFSCQGGPFRGVFNGTLIFVSNTVAGVSQSLGSLLQSASTIIARGTFSPNFNLRRRNLMRVSPRHVLDGMLLAVIIALNALMSTVSWIFKPFVQLFYQHSLTLFFKGILLAVAGLLLKPLGGFLDGLIMVFYGGAETFTAYALSLQVFGTSRKRTEKSRKRQPRLFDVDGQLRPVNAEEGKCQDILTQLGFTDEVFVDNVRLEEYMIIITSARLILHQWDEQKKTDRTRAGKFVYSAVVVGIGVGIAFGTGFGANVLDVGIARGIAIGIAIGIGVGLALAIVRILLMMKVKWNSLFLVGKVIFQSNFQWQISWSTLEAVALELPPDFVSAVAADDDSDGRISPRFRHLRQSGAQRNRPGTPSPPRSPRACTTPDDGQDEDLVKEPRLRFRLRRRPGILPELIVNQSGTVANFSGLSLQATNPANFMWDTIRNRRTRQIVVENSQEAADGLLRLYSRLSTLKGGRFQRQSRAEGKLSRVLEHVSFTDHTSTVGPEWESQWATPRTRRDPRAFSEFVRVVEDSTFGDASEDAAEEGVTAQRGGQSARLKQPLCIHGLQTHL